MMPFHGGFSRIEDDALHARRLHALFDHLPALIAYWDRDLRNVIANAAYVEWFGRTPGQMHGMHIREVLGEELFAKNLPFITGAIAGQEQVFERTLVDTSGVVRRTQASYVPDVVDGECLGFFVLVTDVTARVEAQRALDEAQRMAQLGSWSIDLESGVLTWSEEMYHLVGMDPETFVPTEEGWMDLVEAEDYDWVRSILGDAKRTGSDYDLTYRVRHADGGLREVHSRGRPYSSADGVVRRITGTVQDVTDQNLAARELARVNAQLRRVNLLNADVLAMLGHDVRAPIGVVLGFLEELVEGWEGISDDQRRHFAGRAFGAAQRARSLVDDILAMATVDSGEIMARPEVVEVLDEVRLAVESSGPGAEVAVVADGKPRAFVDPFHLRQIVANLVTNARNHGQPPFRVQVEPAAGASIAITVSDHGPGIPEGRVGTLFERFAGRGSARSSENGLASTGFGLYLAKGLARANAGSLEYVGSGVGAAFRLTLPDGIGSAEPG